MAQAAQDPATFQREFWNGPAGEKWVRDQEKMDQTLGPLGARAMAAGAPAAGEAVLDIGCGCGDTSLQLAKRVGAGGRVQGVDISGPMLARARARAAEAGLDNVDFALADAAGHDFAGPAFDLVFSRFGVMFFTDPTAAFGNIRQGLKPDARLAFICWQPIKANPWMLVPTGVARQILDMPPSPGPEDPGPFSFGDPDRVRRILDGAGFTDIRVEAHEGILKTGGNLAEAVQFATERGPMATTFGQADDDTKARVVAALSEVLAPFETPAGVQLDFASWIVTAASR